MPRDMRARCAAATYAAMMLRAYASEQGTARIRRADAFARAYYAPPPRVLPGSVFSPRYGMPRVYMIAIFAATLCRDVGACSSVICQMMVRGYVARSCGAALCCYARQEVEA